METSQKRLNRVVVIFLVLAVCLSGLPARAQDQPVPSTLTLPAGTVIAVRATDWLSSDESQPGDRFSAWLEQPLVANGWVVAQRGQIVSGRVAIAQKAGRARGVSQLGVELSELTLVDGQVLPVRTQLLESSAGTSKGRDTAIVATTTGAGAAIGAAAHGGEGAAIGAGAGAAVGIIGLLTTRGKPTVIAPETLLTFRLEVPVAISTEGSQVAFRPVSRADYAGNQNAYANRPQRVVAGPRPGPYYYNYAYADGYWGYYAPPSYFYYYGYHGFYGHDFHGFHGFHGSHGGFHH